MDSLVNSAARALAAGDPLAALKRVALREDPPALALRGIAMAQLGDYARARKLLARAARGFTPEERLERARCVAAEAEVALAARDLRPTPRALDAAAAALEALGDRANALHARLVGVRRWLLLGRLEEAEAALAALDVAGAPPLLVALHALARGEIALRRVRAAAAAAAFAEARAAASAAGIAALVAEIDAARRALIAPAARLVEDGAAPRAVTLGDVEALLAGERLVVDACRRAVSAPGAALSLARRPVLFALLAGLAQAWPGDAPRDALIARAFGAFTPNASHRARLRVEIGRLRAAIRPLAGVTATAAGFALAPRRGDGVALLAPPIDGPGGGVLALLAGGEAWSSAALATALGTSQRTLQRALRELETAGQARAIGRGRAQRWFAPSLAGFATTLLLPRAQPVR
jgi:hypothetical protein